MTALPTPLETPGVEGGTPGMAEIITLHPSFLEHARDVGERTVSQAVVTLHPRNLAAEALYKGIYLGEMVFGLLD